MEQKRAHKFIITREYRISKLLLQHTGVIIYSALATIKERGDAAACVRLRGGRAATCFPRRLRAEKLQLLHTAGR